MKVGFLPFFAMLALLFGACAGTPETSVDRDPAVERQDKFERRLRAYKEAAEADPNFPAEDLGLALLLAESGEREALDAAHVVVERFPDLPEAHALLGHVLYELGDLPEAASAYERAIELAPDDAELYKGYANVLENLGAKQQALAVFAYALELAPQDAEALAGRAWLKLDLEDYAGALATYDRYLELVPADADAHNFRGWALTGLGRTEDSITAYERVLELRPDDYDALDMLASCAARARPVRPGPRDVERADNPLAR